MDSREQALETVVASLGDLPALPSVVAEVMQITNDPGATVLQICECIQRDPALAVKILKVSNSPYYGMRQHVATLKLALVVLGVRQVRNIVLGLTVFGNLRDHVRGQTWLRDLWRHSVLVGALSKKLGAALALGLQGEDFVVGLLHDIGKAILYNGLATAYDAIIEASGSGHSDQLCALERESLGFDHADAVAALATHWGLPVSLGDSLWRHHATPWRHHATPWRHHAMADQRRLSAAEDPRLAGVVRIANLAAHDDFSSGDGAQCALCLEQEAWGVLPSPKAPEDVAARFELLSGFRKELAQTPELSFE